MSAKPTQRKERETNVRIELPSGRIVEVKQGECFVGGLNWPSCALGVWVHSECAEHWMRGEFVAERPIDPARTFRLTPVGPEPAR
jgi:hypothetical protein